MKSPSSDVIASPTAVTIRTSQALSFNGAMKPYRAAAYGPPTISAMIKATPPSSLWMLIPGFDAAGLAGGVATKDTI